MLLEGYWLRGSCHSEQLSKVGRFWHLSRYPTLQTSTPDQRENLTDITCSAVLLRSKTSRPSKPHVMQNLFCLDVAGISIRILVLVTSNVVDFEAGYWRGNWASPSDPLHEGSLVEKGLKISI
ncbi:hypothetical protein TNCV_2910401 [Trichonephila clavipes]|nr:hypothetical protein TNCV_2910401 [Trichonephila clavipes]